MGEGNTIKPLFVEKNDAFKVPLPMGEGFRVRAFIV
jgi:hypothetical protein